MLALEGITVLDFCRNAPGMFCTMVLGDLGADVLMVERPMDSQRAAYEQVVSRGYHPGRGAAARGLQCLATQQAKSRAQP